MGIRFCYYYLSMNRHAADAIGTYATDAEALHFVAADSVARSKYAGALSNWRLGVWLPYVLAPDEITVLVNDGWWVGDYDFTIVAADLIDETLVLGYLMRAPSQLLLENDHD